MSNHTLLAFAFIIFLSPVLYAQESTTSTTTTTVTADQVSSQPSTTTTSRPVRRRPKWNDGLSLNSGSIADQFRFVTTRSNSYQNYKVIKRSWLDSLKAHVLDSLRTFNKNLATERLLVATQKDEIEGLKNKLQKANDEIAKLKKDKASISFLGAKMNKSAYSGLVWTIIAGLLGALGFFIYRFKDSNKVTVATRKDLEELREEFDAYKKRALQREQKVRRELQDCLNKRMDS